MCRASYTHLTILLFQLCVSPPESTKPLFDLLMLTTVCVQGLINACARKPTCLHEIVEPLLLKVSDAANMFKLFCICVCTSDPTSVCLLKWSYLSQHSSPMTGGIDGSRYGDPDRDHRQMNRVPVNVEVQEQVEVWILHVRKSECQVNIYSPDNCIERRGIVIG